MQKANQFAALVPEKAPEFEEADFVHLETGVGLDAPSQIWTSPGRETMSARGDPDEPENSFHK